MLCMCGRVHAVRGTVLEVLAFQPRGEDEMVEDSKHHDCAGKIKKVLQEWEREHAVI